MSIRLCIWILAILAGLLGAVHIALAQVIYLEWTLDALWFLGTGLAILFAAAANILALDSPKLRGRIFSIAINLAMTGFFITAWSVLPEPQVIVGGVVFFGLAVCIFASQFGRKNDGLVR